MQIIGVLLTLEIGNSPRLRFELLAEPFVLRAPAFDLLRLAVTRVARKLNAFRSFAVSPGSSRDGRGAAGRLD